MSFYKYDLGQQFRLTKDVMIPVSNSEKIVIGETTLKKGTVFEIESSGASNRLKERYYFADFEDEEFGDINHCFFESELAEFELIS